MLLVLIFYWIFQQCFDSNFEEEKIYLGKKTR